MGSDTDDVFKIITRGYPNTIPQSRAEDNITNNNDENYLTKLLLANCSCKKCVFIEDRDSINNYWCSIHKEKPTRNICIRYESKTPLSQEWAMEKPKEKIFYMTPVYGNEDS